MSEDQPRTYENLIADELPNGLCSKCGMAMMTIDGKRKCPNCSSKTEKGSGLVNVNSDPGEEGLKRALAEPLDKPRYDDLKMIEIPVKQLENLIKPPQNDIGFQAHLDRVYEFLGTVNVDSVSKFKGLLKLKKKVLALQSEIKLYLDTK